MWSHFWDQVHSFTIFRNYLYQLGSKWFIYQISLTLTECVIFRPFKSQISYYQLIRKFPEMSLQWKVDFQVNFCGLTFMVRVHWHATVWCYVADTSTQYPECQNAKSGKINVYNFSYKFSVGNALKLFFLSHQCINNKCINNKCINNKCIN